MGKKYIVELEDGEHLYKTTLNAFGKPVMRTTEKVVPYTEFDLKEVKEKAYKEGYKAGLDDERDRQPDLEQVKKEAYEKGWRAAEDNYDSGYSDGYDAGLDDAWKAAREIVMGDINIITSVFGTASRSTTIRDLTAAEVIEKLKTYEQEQEEIKPGDEFENGSGQRFVVLSKRNKEIYRYIDGEGRSYVMKEKYNTIRKTGRSFPEIVNMLEGLRQPTPAATLEERTAYEIRIQKLRDRLTEFCRKQSSCANCPLNTNEFSCGKGLSFKRIYDDDEKIIPEHDIEAYAAAAGLAYGSNP